MLIYFLTYLVWAGDWLAHDSGSLQFISQSVCSCQFHSVHDEIKFLDRSGGLPVYSMLQNTIRCMLHVLQSDCLKCQPYGCNLHNVTNQCNRGSMRFGASDISVIIKKRDLWLGAETANWEDINVEDCSIPDDDEWDDDKVDGMNDEILVEQHCED